MTQASNRRIQLLNWILLFNNGQYQTLRDIYYFFAKTSQGYKLLRDNRDLMEQFKQLAARKAEWIIK